MRYPNTAYEDVLKSYLSTGSEKALLSSINCIQYTFKLIKKKSTFQLIANNMQLSVWTHYIQFKIERII